MARGVMRTMESVVMGTPKRLSCQGFVQVTQQMVPVQAHLKIALPLKHGRMDAVLL